MDTTALDDDDDDVEEEDEVEEMEEGDAEPAAANDCCLVCHLDDDAGNVICETCDRVYHLACLSPPLDAAPEGDWHCPLCTALADEQAFANSNARIRFDWDEDWYDGELNFHAGSKIRACTQKKCRSDGHKCKEFFVYYPVDGASEWQCLRAYAEAGKVSLIQPDAAATKEAKRSDERLGKQVKFWHDELKGVIHIKASFYYGRVLDVRVETDGAKLYLVEEEDQESGKKKERHWYNLDAMQALGQVKHKSKMMDRVIWGWKHSTIPPPPPKRARPDEAGPSAVYRSLGASAEEAAPRYRSLGAAVEEEDDEEDERASALAAKRETARAKLEKALRSTQTSGGGTAKLARWLEDEDLDRNTGKRYRECAVEIEEAIFRVCRPEYEKKVRDLKANIKRNKELRHSLLGRRTSPDELVRMSMDELASERLQLEREASRQAQYRSVTWQDSYDNVEQRPLVVGAGQAHFADGSPEARPESKSLAAAFPSEARVASSVRRSLGGSTKLSGEFETEAERRARREREVLRGEDGPALGRSSAAAMAVPGDDDDSSDLSDEEVKVTKVRGWEERLEEGKKNAIDLDDGDSETAPASLPVLSAPPPPQQPALLQRPEDVVAAMAKRKRKAVQPEGSEEPPPPSRTGLTGDVAALGVAAPSLALTEAQCTAQCEALATARRQNDAATLRGILKNLFAAETPKGDWPATLKVPAWLTALAESGLTGEVQTLASSEDAGVAQLADALRKHWSKLFKAQKQANASST